MTEETNNTENLVGITIDEQTINIDPNLFRGYLGESSHFLGLAAQAQEDFKGVVDTVAETTGIPKGVLTKYFKAHYKAKTKAEAALGEIFAAFDGMLEKKED